MSDLAPKFCMYCGQPWKQNNQTEYECPKGHKWWNNPCGSSGFIPLRNNKILLAKRAWKPRRGKVQPVGGYMEFNEDSRTALLREVQEEIGVKARIEGIIGTYTALYTNERSFVVAVYYGMIDGEPRPADDVAEVFWHPIDQQIPDPAWPWMEDMRQDLLKTLGR